MSALTSWVDSDSEDDGDAFILATKTAKNVSPLSVIDGVDGDGVDDKPKSQR